VTAESEFDFENINTQQTLRALEQRLPRFSKFEDY
jgi:hypothetical protein